MLRPWQRLTPDIAAAVLIEAPPELARYLLKEAPAGVSASVLAQFEADERERLLAMLDAAVAREAARTLAYYGESPAEITDVGVAGLWRLLERIEGIRGMKVVIAVAGMDAALPTVIGGLISAPVIGVPTSVGYGAAEGGQTALKAMLASCAPGLTVTNIDNGYGAACAALRILRS